MAADTAAPRSRRALLAAAAGAAAATVVAAVERPLPVAAANNDVVQVGHTYDSTMRTQIDSSDTALVGRSNGSWYAGVVGEHFGSEPGHGVFGYNEGTSGHGVQGSGGAIGVRGLNASVGVEGIGAVAGVRGDGGDIGVDGIAHVGGGLNGEGVGVRGSASLGTGVLAISPSGTALYVDGKANFSRSGRATVSAGRYYTDVDLRTKGGLGGSPLILATCQTYRSGIFVAAARKNYPSTGKFRIYLNKTVTASTYVAWIVIG